MNKKLLLLSVLLPLVSSPLAGQETERGFYVSPFGGVAVFRDSSVRVDHVDAIDADFEIKNGYSAGLRGGYDFGLLRLEGEFSYMEGRIRSLESDTGSIDVKSEVESYGYMLNALLDYEIQSFVFSVGAGAGASRIKFGEMSDAGGFVAVADARETVFTYQGIFSSRYRLSENAALGFNYRYLAIPDVSDRGFVDTNPGKTDIDYDSFGVSLFELFFTWRF